MHKEYYGDAHDLRVPSIIQYSERLDGNPVSRFRALFGSIPPMVWKPLCRHPCNLYIAYLRGRREIFFLISYLLEALMI